MQGGFPWNLHFASQVTSCDSGVDMIRFIVDSSITKCDFSRMIGRLQKWTTTLVWTCSSTSTVWSIFVALNDVWRWHRSNPFPIQLIIPLRHANPPTEDLMRVCEQSSEPTCFNYCMVTLEADPSKMGLATVMFWAYQTSSHMTDWKSFPSYDALLLPWWEMMRQFTNSH